MTKPTSENPYVTFMGEPPGWHDSGNTKPWETHKGEVQTANGVWWSKRTEGGNYAHQHETPLDIEGSGFPLGLGNRYGPFIYAPFPLDGKTKWGFQRKDGLDQFIADLAKDEIPKGGAVAIMARPAPAKEEGDFFADLDMSPSLEPISQDPFADLDMGSTTPEPAPAPEEDPFAALDGTSPAPVPEPPVAPPSPPPVADSVDDEPETDEWGQVIAKSDPFADL